MDVFPCPIVAPRTEVGPDRRPRWKVMRQGTPLTPGAVPIKDRIEYVAHIGAARTPAGLGGRDQRLQDGPFLLGQIAGIALRSLSHPFPLRGGRWFLACPHRNRVLLSGRALRTRIR